jgi:hypothetical protein
MILAENEVKHFDTDWGGIFGWCDTMPVEESTYRQLWGTDYFVSRCPSGRGYFWQAATQI